MKSLEESIKRMLVYYDPWGLIRTGAPADEYDSYIYKMVVLVQNEDICGRELKEEIKTIFDQQGMPKQHLSRAIDGCAEGIEFERRIKND